MIDKEKIAKAVEWENEQRKQLSDDEITACASRHGIRVIYEDRTEYHYPINSFTLKNKNKNTI